MTNAFRAIRLTNNILSGDGGTGISYAGNAIMFQSQTGVFYPSSNPSGFITSAQAGGIQSITITGIATSGALTFAGGSGISLTLNNPTNNIITINANTGSFITSTQTGILVGTNQTGILVGVNQTGAYTNTFATIANTGLLLVGVNQTGILVGVNQTGAYTNTFATIANTGLLLVGKNQTGQFIWTGSQQSFTTVIPLGVENTGILFPVSFGGPVPKIQATLEVTGDIMYGINIRIRSTTGYFAMFSDIISESGVTVHTFATL